MADILYHAVPGDWRREQKYAWLDEVGHVGNVPWTTPTPDKQNNWLTGGLEAGFANFLPIGSKEAKADPTANISVVFSTYSRGLTTSRDDWMFAFDCAELAIKANRFVGNYNLEVARYRQANRPPGVADFITTGKAEVKWTDRLKDALSNLRELEFQTQLLRHALYRPFIRRFVYFDDLLVHRRYQQHRFFPIADAETENRQICLTDLGSEKPFMVLASKYVADLHLVGGGATAQCFPFYTYHEDGTARRENIPDAAQIAFWKHYGDESITKWDIFHYVYGLLHHPGYRERFAGNLRRELPRLPFAPDFRAFADAGRQLAELHVGYETQPEFPLKRVENRAVARNLRVEKMRFTAPDRAAIRYNAFLTLEGIPPEAHAYRLGNRSALEWVLDQFAVSHDKASGLTSDPNQPDDETAILRLLGQVITVSVGTVRLVDGLPRDFGAGETPGSGAYRQWRLQPSSLSSAEASEQREEMRLMTREHLSKDSPPNGTPSSVGPKRRTASPAKPTS